MEVSEIKFRGQRIDNGEWIEGALDNSDDRETFICYRTKDYEYYPIRVKPETVGQYVGIKENSSEKSEDNRCIYKGDIVEFVSGTRLVVEWNDDYCRWEYSDGTPINEDDSYNCHRHILGNIHQNPELLNDKPQTKNA